MTSRPRPAAPRWATILLVAAVIGVALWRERREGVPAVPPPGPDVSAPSPEPAPQAGSSPREKASDAFELREVRRGVFESPAGLIYRSGGQEGHRIEHVLQHAQDDPSKPVHGVFHGERNDILALIDESYALTQTRGPPTVESEREGGRTIFTVDLGRDIGHLGGQSGARRQHPALDHLRLVLEDREVITAFPVAGP